MRATRVGARGKSAAGGSEAEQWVENTSLEGVRDSAPREERGGIIRGGGGALTTDGLAGFCGDQRHNVILLRRSLPCNAGANLSLACESLPARTTTNSWDAGAHTRRDDDIV